jgi:DNA-binding beta-propeller fold protein YncE/mono/diheme cytochrome c family protein
MRRAALVVFLAIAGCSPKPSGGPSAADSVVPPEPPASSAPEPPHLPPESIAAVVSVDRIHEGGRVALATVDGVKVALVADEDRSTVEIVDVAAKTILASTPLEGAPSQLLIAGGRIIVALRDRARVVVFAATHNRSAPLFETGHFATSVEPLALATSSDDSRLFVASGWGRTVDAFNLDTGEKTLSVRVGREPRAIAATEDALYVTHAAEDSLTRIDLAHPESKPTTIDMNTDFFGTEDMVMPPFVAREAFAITRAGDNLIVPHTIVDSGGKTSITSGYGGGSASVATTTAFTLDAFDVRHKDPLPTGGAATEALDSRFFGPGSCLLPRAAAYDARTKSVLVACVGADVVVAYDSTRMRQGVVERKRWKVPSGPMGLAVDSEARAAYVFSMFDGVLSRVALDAKGKGLEGERIATFPRQDDDAARGRRLFSAAGDPRVAKDGRACASCHPDGRDDGLVWSTPKGPSQTIMLAGRVDRPAPFGWRGEHASLPIHLAQTFKNLGGTGLPENDVAALIAYVTTLAPPVRVEPTTSADAISRGKHLFASVEVGCANCHADGGSDHDVHDIGSATPVDRSRSFATPSLHFVAGTAPYFHDGRYATLDELLRKSDGMGTTKGLSAADLAALEAYVVTL